MPNKQDSEQLFGGYSLDDWDGRWERQEEGFALSDLSRLELKEVGLFRAVRGTETMYIARAVEHNHGGLSKGLQRIVGPEQTGNNKYGAQMIRKHMHELELDILKVGFDLGAAKVTAELKKAFIELLDPEWNRPQNRRLAEMRAAAAAARQRKLRERTATEHALPADRNGQIQ